MRLSGDEIDNILNNNNLPNMACPFCGKGMTILIYDVVNNPKKHIGYTCTCADWEIMETDMQIAELDEVNNADVRKDV